MRRIINGICMALLCLSFTACTQEKTANDKADIQIETVEMSEEDKNVFADEIAEMENYKGITDISKAQKIYNLEDESQNSVLALSLIRALPVNGLFQYTQTIQGDIYIFTLKNVDGRYCELVYNTTDGTYGMQVYDDLKSVVETEDGADNITREITAYYLVSGSDEKYIGQFAKNISVSESIDVLKKYEGQTDISAYADAEWDNPYEMLEKNYDETYGMQSYMRYIVKADETLYLCTINQAPEGYCLTYYDPAADWFEVREYKLLIKKENGAENEYYLTNDADASFKKNSLKDGDTDGFVYIGQ